MRVRESERRLERAQEKECGGGGNGSQMLERERERKIPHTGTHTHTHTHMNTHTHTHTHKGTHQELLKRINQGIDINPEATTFAGLFYFLFLLPIIPQNKTFVVERH